MEKYGIIGTAGRDKTKPMTLALWQWMVADAMKRVPKGAHVVSGGAAWADHLAVILFLEGHASSLMLYLPSPMNLIFEGPANSSASAANYYHDLFSNRIGRWSLEDIITASGMENCNGMCEPWAHGYRGMFARNAKVAAESTTLLAYTFGEGDQPADGGTLDTWNKCKGNRIHIQLPIIY